MTNRILFRRLAARGLPIDAAAALAKRRSGGVRSNHSPSLAAESKPITAGTKHLFDALQIALRKILRGTEPSLLEEFPYRKNLFDGSLALYADSKPEVYDHGIGVNRDGIRYWADFKDEKLRIIYSRNGASIDILLPEVNEFKNILRKELPASDKNALDLFEALLKKLGY